LPWPPWATQQDLGTILSVVVAQGGQGKYSHMSLLLALSPTNVANVNEPLLIDL